MKKTTTEKILTSNFFIYLCFYLFPILLVQNWIFDYPNRFRDHFGMGFIVIAILMYFLGFLMASDKKDEETIKTHFWLHIGVWGFGIVGYNIFLFMDFLFGSR